MYIVKSVLRLTDPVTYLPLKTHTQVHTKDGGCIRGDLEYSWSVDGVCWTGYVDFNTYTSITKNLGTDFYLRILLPSSYEMPMVYINGEPRPYTVTIYSPNPFNIDACAMLQDSSCFDMYEGWDCAIQMQQSMSDAVICTLGIPIYYFKVEPDLDTADFNFKEYIMHSVRDVKQLRMMIPGGEMPSSKPMLSDWDWGFEVDWEVELSKTQFSTAFGDIAYPRARDFIWVPMQKRMYEVNSAYDEKNEGLMWRATTWKLALVKYNEKTNVELGDIGTFVDDLIINKYEDIFTPLEEKEQKRTEVHVLQAPAYAANTLYSIAKSDFIRKNMSIDSISIQQRQLNNKNIIVSKNMYALKRDSVIEYQDKFCGEDGTISLIIDTPVSTLKEERKILSIGYIDIIYKDGDILFGDHKISLDSSSTYMVIFRWTSSLMILDAIVYKYIYPTNIPAYSLKPAMCSFDTTSPVYNNSVMYLENLRMNRKSSIYLYGYPFNICTFKLYNKYINDDELGEVFKYTTNNENNIINDVCKPINGNHGYSVK